MFDRNLDLKTFENTEGYSTEAVVIPQEVIDASRALDKLRMERCSAAGTTHQQLLELAEESSTARLLMFQRVRLFGLACNVFDHLELHNPELRKFATDQFVSGVEECLINAAKQSDKIAYRFKCNRSEVFITLTQDGVLRDRSFIKGVKAESVSIVESIERGSSLQQVAQETIPKFRRPIAQPHTNSPLVPDMYFRGNGLAHVLTDVYVRYGYEEGEQSFSQIVGSSADRINSVGRYSQRNSVESLKAVFQSSSNVGDIDDVFGAMDFNF